MKRYTAWSLILILLLAAGCQAPAGETPPVPSTAPSTEATPIPTPTPEAEPTETPSAIAPYDANGDGVLQTIEFPLPTGEVFGLEGENAALYTKLAETVMELSFAEEADREWEWFLYLSEKAVDLVLPHFTIVGEYDGENGEKNYVGGFGIYMYYGLSNGLVRYDPKYRVYNSVGGGGAFSRITFATDGTFLDIQQTYNGADNTERVKELCGPLTEVAEAWINETEYPYGERCLPDLDFNKMLELYVNYYFCQ